MKMLLLDLFFAGMETTVTTLKWGFLLAVLHPNVQRRVQEELDNECAGTAVTLADRPRLPYTQATINVRVLQIRCNRRCFGCFSLPK